MDVIEEHKALIEKWSREVEQSPDQERAYKLAVEAEQATATISEYRERIRIFDLLVRSIDHKCLKQQEDIVKYLVGSIYVNFEKLWGPTIRTIQAVIDLSKWKTNLLKIILLDIKKTNAFIYNEELLQSHIACDKKEEPEIKGRNDKPDFVLHRHLLYQTLINYPSTIEENEDLQKLYIDSLLFFVDKELLVSPFIEKFKHQNLLLDQKENLLCDETKQNIVQGTLQNQTTNTTTKNKRQKVKRDVGGSSDKKRIRDTFNTSIKVVKDFKNLRGCHRHDEIQEILLSLLTSRDNSVQSAAFNCYLSYDYEYLKPYSKRISNLLNDRKIRTEFAVFSLDSDEYRTKTTGNKENVIDHVVESHRKNVMPIILRIIFGKMLGRIGKRSGGKEQSDHRKALVMRFIAGCKTDEILFFLSLIVGSVYNYADKSYNQIEKLLSLDKLNLQEYMPLSTLHAILATLHSFMDNIANSNPEVLPYLMKILLVLTILIQQPLSISDKIPHLKNVKILKDLSRRCLLSFKKFFSNFEYYEYKSEEIDLIFRHLIWKASEDFSNRNNATVTPLMQLIETFSSSEIYLPLLVKSHPSSNNTLLGSLISLFEVKPNFIVDRKILKHIANIIVSILKGGKEECDDEDLMDLDDDNKSTNQLLALQVGPMYIAPYNETDFLPSKESTSSFGIEILKGYTDVIFERLQYNCKELIDRNRLEFKIEPSELEITSILGKILRKPEQCIKCAKLLILTLKHRGAEDIKLLTINTAHSLVTYIHELKDPEFINMIAENLGTLRNMTLRKQLCQILVTVSKVQTSLVVVSRTLVLMNEMVEDIIDKPDIEKMNEGFGEAFKLIELIDVEDMNDIVILLMHQVAFFILNNDKYEFSIRDNCVQFFEKLSLKMKKSSNSCFDALINQVLLKKYIKKGLRDTNESTRHLFISLLRSFAMNCPEKGTPWNEFNLFCDNNIEVDFWLTIKHIQLHTRSKALARLNANKNLEKVSSKTLSTYFLPIASSFLFNKNYKTLASLTGNSIKLIAKVCAKLNWSTYESILDYYLSMLTKAKTSYQSTSIKIVTEITKSFNFDLSACEDAIADADENSKLQEAMKKRSKLNITSDQTAILRVKKLNPSTAKLVYQSIVKRVLPKLFSCLHEATHIEYENDKNMAGYKPEMDEIKRIPIALAIVQVLDLLPNKYIHMSDNLPTIFMRLSSFLKSKSDNVRRSSRDILVRIMTFLGPAYLPDVLKELHRNLEKGFQVHVLNYTIHSILNKIPLQYGDLDHSVETLLSSSVKEIFGKVAEDKEVAQIIAKTFEAKKTKSYETLQILATYISHEKRALLTNDFITSHLRRATDPKIVNKLEQCIHRVYTGLIKNSGYPFDKLLTFIEDNIRNSLPSLKEQQKFEQAEKLTYESLRPDRYLIEKELPRDRVKSKINEKGNLHLVVESNLRLLWFAMKKNQENFDTKPEYKEKLDGFVQLLSTCLNSTNARCITRSLKCIYFIAQAKSDLKSFVKESEYLVKNIFILLHKYNGVGMVRGDNYEMIMMCFKTLTLLLIRCDSVKLKQNQLKAFLSYIEQDIHDDNRRSTALKALQSIIKKKLQSPDIASIMKKVADLVVTAQDHTVRQVAVGVWSSYLLDYPHSNNMLQNHLKMFMRQIDYEYVDGRKSLINMFDIIVEKFPTNIVQDHYELLFHLLSQRLVNEDNEDVRKLVHSLLAKLLKRLPEKEQNHVFHKILTPWGHNDQVTLNSLAIKQYRIYIEGCRRIFDLEKTKVVLAFIATYLKQEQEIRMIEPNHEENVTDVEYTDDEVENHKKSVKTKPFDTRLVSAHDILIVDSLSLFKHMIEEGLIGVIDVRFIDYLTSIWHSVASKKLVDWYMPVVILSCELYDLFLAHSDLAGALKSSESSNPKDYIRWNAKRIVRTLCDQFLSLLDRAGNSKNLETHVTTSMIKLGLLILDSSITQQIESEYLSFIIKTRDKKKEAQAIIEHLLLLEKLPNNGFDERAIPEKFTKAKKRIDLFWLATKVVMQARKEAATERLDSYHRRRFVLRWTAAMIDTMGPKRLPIYAFLFVMTPVRELTDQHVDKSKDSPQKPMLTMAEDLLKIVKNLLGADKFNIIYSNVQLYFTKKRIERKKTAALSKVLDQVKGVKRKLKQSSTKSKVRRLKTRSKYTTK